MLNNRAIDRTFDAACLKVKGETEWAETILNRIKSKYPADEAAIELLYDKYVVMVTNNPTFLSRAEYMIENRDKLRLRY